jgi:hypothetical protein
MTDPDPFHEMQEAVRAGRYSTLKHFRSRVVERGFTVDQAVQVLAQTGVLAWHAHGGRAVWLVTEPLQPEPGQQLHVRVKLTTQHTALLITGWLADRRKHPPRWVGMAAHAEQSRRCGMRWSCQLTAGARAVRQYPRARPTLL